MKAVFLLAVVAIVFQSQLVSADPLSLLPITSLTDLVNNLGAILTALIKTVLGLVCTVVGTLVGTITSLLPSVNIQVVGSLLCDGTLNFDFTAVFQLLTSTLVSLLSLLGIPQLLAALSLPLALIPSLLGL